MCGDGLGREAQKLQVKKYYVFIFIFSGALLYIDFFIRLSYRKLSFNVSGQLSCNPPSLPFYVFISPFVHGKKKDFMKRKLKRDYLFVIKQSKLSFSLFRCDILSSKTRNSNKEMKT